jgi:magnesium chelatase family protein
VLRTRTSGTNASRNRRNRRATGASGRPSFATVPASASTFTILGVEAQPVRVEVDVRSGLPSFSLVGLPDAAVRESRDRVRAAVANAGFQFPQQRIIANLAPGDLRKGGPGLDLAIAAALLGSSNQLDAARLDRIALAGELALDGSIRAVPGVLAMAEAARRTGARAFAVPVENGPEAALVRGPRIVPISHLAELRLIGAEGEPPPPRPLSLDSNGATAELPDLDELRGEPTLRRALEVAAAGAHNLLLVGPPGAGKSLAARRIPSILPPLTEAEAIEVLRIASACGRPAALDARLRPFRAPHHTISTAGLVGGGTPPRAGEITLAHRGVLFLDELGEFRRDALEALRQPLEDGTVSIVRARHAVALPCRFMLIAATNPCPCGSGADDPGCECAPGAVVRYQARVSGALADRIDATIMLQRPTADDMSADPGESSAAVRERVCRARKIQADRLGEGRANGDATGGEMRRVGAFMRAAKERLRQSYEALGMSGRGYDRTLRLARTVADLQGSEHVHEEHVEEALALRRRTTQVLER